jgi:hypothetical protein
MCLERSTATTLKLGERFPKEISVERQKSGLSEVFIVILGDGLGLKVFPECPIDSGGELPIW